MRPLNTQYRSVPNVTHLYQNPHIKQTKFSLQVLHNNVEVVVMGWFRTVSVSMTHVHDIKQINILYYFIQYQSTISSHQYAALDEYWLSGHVVRDNLELQNNKSEFSFEEYIIFKNLCDISALILHSSRTKVSVK